MHWHWQCEYGIYDLYVKSRDLIEIETPVAYVCVHGIAWHGMALLAYDTLNA